MEAKRNVVGWFEIPVADMERAIKFYESVLGYTLSRNKIEEIDMAWFPWVSGADGAAGSLVYHEEWYKPSSDGTLIYFNSPSGELENELALVEKNGGKVLMPKTPISAEHGFFALLLDTEGNRVALHSMK